MALCAALHKWLLFGTIAVEALELLFVPKRLVLQQQLIVSSARHRRFKALSVYLN